MEIDGKTPVQVVKTISTEVITLDVENQRATSAPIDDDISLGGTDNY